MSGTWPTSPAPAAVSLRSLTRNRISVAHNFKRQRRALDLQRFALALTYPIMNRATFAPLLGFLLDQEGTAENFSIAAPTPYATPLGSWSGAPVVDGASQEGNSVNLRGFTASQVGVVKALDLVQFAGHAKVYVATADSSSDGSGDAVLSIQPALMASPADGAAVTHTPVVFTMALASDLQELAALPGDSFPSFTLELVEDV